MTDIDRIRVVCTGNESHREVFMQTFEFDRLGTARLGDDSRIQWTEENQDWREVRIESRPRTPLKKEYTFDCRRCVRETRMKARTLRTALDGLRAAGKAVLDISHLPY